MMLIFPALGQETINNFHSENQQIIWESVFETQLQFVQLSRIIKESGLFDNLEVTENKLTGMMKDMDADFKGAGLTELSTPIYIARSYVRGFAIVEYKDGKYRAQLKKIILIQKYNDALSQHGQTTNLESFALKKGTNEIKNAFKKSPSLILDHTFQTRFQFASDTKKDW